MINNWWIIQAGWVEAPWELSWALPRKALQQHRMLRAVRWWGQHYHHKTPLFLTCNSRKWPERKDWICRSEAGLGEKLMAASSECCSAIQKHTAVQEEKTCESSRELFSFQMARTDFAPNNARVQGQPPEHGSVLQEMHKNKIPVLFNPL